jgi:hypothetical protein
VVEVRPLAMMPSAVVDQGYWLAPDPVQYVYWALSTWSK